MLQKSCMSLKNAVSVVVGLEAGWQEFIDVTHSFSKLSGRRRNKILNTISRRTIRIKHPPPKKTKGDLSSVQFSSVAQLCPTLCDPMNCSTPGLPVHHQLLEFTQIHVHWVSDAIQPSHPLSSPSPPAPNPSQHQSLFLMSQLFTWGGQSTGVSALA